MTEQPKPRKHTSAAALIDKPVVCPTCGGMATLRRDEHGYWIQCDAIHRPVPGVRAETILEEQPE